MDPIGIAERERPGPVGRRRRKVTSRGQRSREFADPFVGHGALPGQQCEASAGSEGTPDVGERGDQIPKEHGGGSADRDVESLGVERVHLRIGLLERDIARSVRP